MYAKGSYLEVIKNNNNKLLSESDISQPYEMGPYLAEIRGRSNFGCDLERGRR